MNKNLSIVNLILTIGLLAAVIFLFTKNNPSDSDLTTDNQVVDKDTKLVNNRPDSLEADFSQLKVVYINTDSLWDNYEYVQTELKSLEREEARLQASYEAKMTKLEKDYTDYMQKGKANLLTLKQQQDMEASLEKQQLDIKQLEEEATKKLVIRKQEINQQINDTIQAFINRYRIVNGYDLILQHSYLNGVLSATSDIDITYDVLSKLNEEYRSFKKK